MKISIIAAVSENMIIGKEGNIPWKLKTDMQRFRELTIGHCVIMGRYTKHSIPGEGLPKRTNIVLTSLDATVYSPCITSPNLADALTIAYERGETEAFVIGGAKPYREALAIADRLYLTKVHAWVNGDVSFPRVYWEHWKLISEEDYPADELNEYPYSFCLYEKI